MGSYEGASACQDSRRFLLMGTILNHSGLKSEKMYNFREAALFSSKAKINIFQRILRKFSLMKVKKNIDFSL